MRKYTSFLALLFAVTTMGCSMFGASRETPITGGKLTDNLNANRQSITNINSLVFSNGTVLDATLVAQFLTNSISSSDVLSNIVIAGVAGTITVVGSNVIASVSLESLAGAGVTTNTSVGATGYYVMSNGVWVLLPTTGDMLKSEYDAGGVKQVAFTRRFLTLWRVR
jgi:hypothetical protein